MVARRNPVVPRRMVSVGGFPVQTTVTARPAVVRRWLPTTLWLQRRRLRFAPGGITVGLGVQWTPPFRKLPAGAEPRPGTLQLCVGNRCLVFQLARAGGRGAPPQILRRFLADGRCTFAGYYVASDCRKLRAHHGLEVVASTLEICGAAGMGRASMEDMAERLLGIRIEKPELVGNSRWDAATLSREQVRYAAVDAYISYRLGVYLRAPAFEADSDDTGSETSSEPDDSDDTGSETSSEPDDSDDTGSEASSEPDDWDDSLEE